MLPLIDDQNLISIREPRDVLEPYQVNWYRPATAVMPQL